MSKVALDVSMSLDGFTAGSAAGHKDVLVLGGTVTHLRFRVANA